MIGHRWTLVPGLAIVLVASTVSGAVPAVRGSGAAIELEPAGSTPHALGRPGPAFEENLGQADASADFVWRGERSLALISNGGATLLRHGEPVSVELVGAAPNRAMRGRGLLPGRTSYFRGADPAGWVTGVRSFERVRVRSAYPGVDVLWHADPDGRLEYDLIIRPGADADAPRIAVRGADAAFSPDGDLLLSARGADVRLHRPVAYQRIGGRRAAVRARYRLGRDGTIGIELGRYDRRRPLVIDPVLEYSTFLGGGLNDWATAVAGVEDGSTVVVGYTDSEEFPGDQGHGERFAQDVFVTKIAPDGTLAYSAYIGGGAPASMPDPLELGCSSPLMLTGLFGACGIDIGTGVTLDDQGNAYVVGHTSAGSFPVRNAVQPAFGGGFNDGFALKLDPEGDELLYSTYLGGRGDEQLESVTVDGGGRAHVVGTSTSLDFPTANAAQPLPAGAEDVVAARLSPTGSELEWGTYLGGSGGDWGDGVAVAPDGSTYLVGHTGSSDFPVRDALQPDFGGGQDGGQFSLCPCDGFVARVGPSGSTLDTSTFLGGSGNDKVRDAVIDGEGRLHTIGYTVSADFPLREPFQDGNHGDADAFVSIFTADATSLEFSTYLGGFLPEEGAGIDVDGCGNVYAAGYTSSRDFPVHRSFQEYNPGATKEQNDGYVAKFDPDRRLVYATLLGGRTYDGIWGLDVTASGTAHLAGFTGSDNFPVANASQPTFGGNTDAFASRIADEACAVPETDG